MRWRSGRSDEEFKNPVDLMFDELESGIPATLPSRQYKKYKLAAGKTAKSILISCARALLYLILRSCGRSRPMMSWNWIPWETGKLPCFLIMSDTDDSFNFLISMCYTQLF